MPKSENLIRVRLTSGHSGMTCYVDDHPHLKVGVSISLEDSEQPDRLWVVQEIHETIQRCSIKRGWNNNI